jgi:membrane-associated phospholipid phosphatase
VLIFLISIGLDVPVSGWVHDSGLSGAMKNAQGAAHIFIHYGLRFFGLFWFTLAAAIVLLAMNRGRDAMVVLLAGIFSAANQLLKWCFGRVRPYHGYGAFSLHPFYQGLAGLKHAEISLGFPSGDATLAFAMTASLSWVWPRWTVLWWGLGVWTCIERVAEGAHYPSDTVAGAFLGIFVAHVARWVVNRVAPSQREMGA